MIAFKGCWYLLPLEEPEPYDEFQALFPFYDLDKMELYHLVTTDINDCWGEWPCKMPRCPDWQA